MSIEKSAFSALLQIGYDVHAKHKKYVLHDSNKKCVFVKKQRSDISSLAEVIHSSWDEVSKEKILSKKIIKQKQLLASYKNIKERLIDKNNFNFIFKFFLYLLSCFFSSTKINNKINAMKNLMKDLDIRIQKLHHLSDEVESHEEALSKFYGKFNSLFTTKVSAPIKEERVIINMISKLFWNSQDVQGSKQKLEKYLVLMQEFFIGSHFLFIQKENSSVLENIKLQIDKIQKRRSSHYVKKKHFYSDWQNHIKGQQHPEILFGENFLAQHKNNGEILKAQLFENSSHAKEYNPIKVFWIQCEKTPLDSNICNTFKHSINFIHYNLLKIVSKRAQIAKYTSKKLGHGIADKYAIIINPYNVEQNWNQKFNLLYKKIKKLAFFSF